MTKSKLSAVVALLWCGTAVANNSPENGQRHTQEDIVPKVDFACGIHLTVEYDSASLKQHNKDIRQDTTDGESECNEPLRLIWYACKTDAGKSAIKAANLHKVACKGTPNPTGSLRISDGVVTVERSLQEIEAPAADEFSRMRPAKPTGPEKQYVRSHRQFESAMKLSLALASEDPYNDQAWRDLAQQPNPVTSTKDYCLVNGKTMAPEANENEADSMVRRKEDGTVKCWLGGEVITDLQIKKGQRNGFSTYVWTKEKERRRTSYRDGKRNGEETLTKDGRVAQTILYDADERVWERELFPSGKLKSYMRQTKNGQGRVSIGEDGRVYSLDCRPDLRDDKDLRKWCGFEGANTVQIYDGTGKVSHVQTWKDGLLQKEGAGNSAYAAGATVAYKDGKKHGEERIVDKDGKLHLTIEWSHGVQDGKEREYAEDGKKVVKETVYKAGEIQEITEYFLNGNPKSRETFDAKDRKTKKQFWDTGKVREEGVFVLCPSRWGGNDWCADGTHKLYYENGAHQGEQPFEKGSRKGTSTSWWPNGKPQSVESYTNDKRTKAKHWDKDGKVILDEEYEADGSRKRK